MTNEELAILIKSGEKQYVKDLWEQIEPLLYLLSVKYYTAYKEKCEHCGIEVNDIFQESYFAMLDAIEYFKAEYNYKFNTYLSRTFLKNFNQMLGRTQKQQKEPLKTCISLNTVLKDSEGDLTLLDVIADENSIDFVQEIENRVDVEKIKKRLKKFPKPKQKIIELYFFENKSLKEVGTEMGFSGETTRTKKEAILQQLRKPQRRKNDK